MSVLLFGSRGYLGSSIAAELDRRGKTWRAGDWRGRPKMPVGASLVINAAAYIPRPSVAACDQNPMATIDGNLRFPSELANACWLAEIPFAHLSTGCLWNDGKEHDEESPPQRSFNGHCGFYVGIKVAAEVEVRRQFAQHYIWRVRLPYDEIAGPKNYLSKLTAFPEVWGQVNSASHRADFAKAALDLWEAKAPWGTYHLVNPGTLTASDVVARMVKRGILAKAPVLVDRHDGECRLSCAKAIATGIKIRSAEDALEDALERWT